MLATNIVVEGKPEFMNETDAHQIIFSSSKLATKFKGIRVLIFFFYEFHTQILLYGQLCI